MLLNSNNSNVEMYVQYSTQNKAGRWQLQMIHENPNLNIEAI